MTWVLWSWDAPREQWREACCGSQKRMQELVLERTAQAADFSIPGTKFIALPTGQRPDGADAPDVLPLKPVEHAAECWRLPSHHDCAVTLIEGQLIEIRGLLDRIGELERFATPLTARQPA